MRLLAFLIPFQFLHAPDFGNFPRMEKEKLWNDLEILYQGLNKFHSGMYWYTPKDSIDMAFESVRESITEDLNVLEFHKLIAPLVALSREDHTNIYLPFVMNVKPKLPFGRGVMPHYEVIPTFDEYINGENASLKYILEQLEHEE